MLITDYYTRRFNLSQREVKVIMPISTRERESVSPHTTELCSPTAEHYHGLGEGLEASPPFSHLTAVIRCNVCCVAIIILS